MRTAGFLLAVVLLAACAGPGARPSAEGKTVRLAVPFFPDGTDQCGPSVLASVLGFWGKPAEPAELKKEIYRAHLKGALTVDMLLAAQERGLAADVGGGGLVEVKKELDAGRPVIAFLNVGLRAYPIGHYLVITGYDDSRQVIIAHSGRKRDRRIAYKTFDKAWERTERWALLIKPRS
ncbi:MAG: C39 family peptidase [Elusimicrobiota bacterium]|nr:C39 family peptidase [Elusimicrobiota bacterium]